MTIQRIPFGIATVPVMRQLLLGRSVLRRIAPCHTLDFTQGTSSRFFSINSYYLSKDGTQETKGCQGPGHIHASPEPNKPKRIVVGITGATGAVYAIRILTILRHLGVETHLIISKWALATLKYETAMTEAEIRALSSRSYTAKDLSAPIASGSFQHDGMMIVPCSMKTLAAKTILVAPRSQNLARGYYHHLLRTRSPRTRQMSLGRSRNWHFLHLSKPFLDLLWKRDLPTWNCLGRWQMKVAPALRHRFVNHRSPWHGKAPEFFSRDHRLSWIHGHTSGPN
ncbi:Flavoprotein [Macrophomina phaseolina MS6]|uniref:Flavoprotein n=1 Tax=Macrophomina phaseolina (strain MS6) TaxID=1126212 RepID=K2QHA9_MACPH|nr:Flavoprotein [Macrophomina phaseolina MS6]